MLPSVPGACSDEVANARLKAGPASPAVVSPPASVRVLDVKPTRPQPISPSTTAHRISSTITQGLLLQAIHCVRCVAAGIGIAERVVDRAVDQSRPGDARSRRPVVARVRRLLERAAVLDAG